MFRETFYLIQPSFTLTKSTFLKFCLTKKILIIIYKRLVVRGEFQNNELLFITSIQNPCFLGSLSNLTIREWKHCIEKGQYFIEIR